MRLERELQVHINNLKLQLLKDDMEIYQMMQLTGGYRLDSQKLNRVILDKLKQKQVIEVVNAEENVEDKQVIYHEVNLFGTQQLKSRVKHYSQKTFENIPIPGRLPMSDIASLLGSNMDFSETQKMLNSEEHLTSTSLNLTRQHINHMASMPIHQVPRIIDQTGETPIN